MDASELRKRIRDARRAQGEVSAALATAVLSGVPAPVREQLHDERRLLDDDISDTFAALRLIESREE